MVKFLWIQWLNSLRYFLGYLMSRHRREINGPDGPVSDDVNPTFERTTLLDLALSLQQKAVDHLTGRFFEQVGGRLIPPVQVPDAPLFSRHYSYGNYDEWHSVDKNDHVTDLKVRFNMTSKEAVADFINNAIAKYKFTDLNGQPVSSLEALEKMVAAKLAQLGHSIDTSEIRELRQFHKELGNIGHLTGEWHFYYENGAVSRMTLDGKNISHDNPLWNAGAILHQSANNRAKADGIFIGPYNVDSEFDAGGQSGHVTKNDTNKSPASAHHKHVAHPTV